MSIGAGNCDAEVAFATTLRNQGFDNFTIECLELNEKMLDRGTQLARDAEVSSNLAFVRADFNRWSPRPDIYDAAIANQALHHVQELEHLLDSIKRSMKPGALFVISDMIGRNGHLRWPEALTIVHEFWASLPEKYKYNHQLKRVEEAYVNWDCSTEGFEGIRAQDILPLLVRYFHFDLFIGFGNIIDPFIDRSFGPNFDQTCEWDRSFIDRVHERDEREITRGGVKPTHMIAVLTKEPREVPKYHPPLSPEFSIRRPDS
ncbi:MAG: class I SAM-dependent methyltransferase [Acidobacteriota bacterium]|nr:class I SAM-dependent methyltransferase [Acidobacteriota bacterium]